MLAIVAAVIFGLGLLLDFADADLGDAFTPTTLMMAGLFCLALHFAGVGTTTRLNSRRGSRR
jgi:hypothetical protein